VFTPPLDPEFSARALADQVELQGIGHCPRLDVPLETAQLILVLTDR